MLDMVLKILRMMEVDCGDCYLFQKDRRGMAVGVGRLG